MLQPLSDVLKLRTWTMDSKAAQLYRILTGSLTPLIEAEDLSGCDTMLHIVEGLRILTTDLNQIRRTPKAESVLSAPNQSVLIWLRSMVMHALLSLPDHTTQNLEFQDTSSQIQLMYRICRTACFMYAQVWLHPIANKGINMARKLVTRMQPLLMASTSCLFHGSTLSTQHPELFLWALILTLMCAYEDSDITGELDSMQQIAPFIRGTQIEPSPESWTEIPDILEKFLWAHLDCDLTGREAWQQACTLLSSSIVDPAG